MMRRWDRVHRCERGSEREIARGRKRGCKEIRENQRNSWSLLQVGEVRLASVSVLESLYNSEETAPHLELFTQRFKERLLSMRLDKEDSVCVKAIRLACHLLKLDLLEPEDCVEVQLYTHTV